MGYICTIGGCSTTEKQPRENADVAMSVEEVVSWRWDKLEIPKDSCTCHVCHWANKNAIPALVYKSIVLKLIGVCPLETV